ncbi:hypothetical protein LIT25_20905 [Bacillus sp. F19]|nr:hypothetical protein LIT25_20905 [Bacillus sp. F19]
MTISSIMAGQASQLQHTLSMNLLQSQMATQAANVTVKMEDFTKVQTFQIIHLLEPRLIKRLNCHKRPVRVQWTGLLCALPWLIQYIFSLRGIC